MSKLKQPPVSVDQSTKEAIKAYLDHNVMLNRFGLVNLAVIRCIEGTENYLDHELKAIIQSMFGPEMVTGVVSFMEERCTGTPVCGICGSKDSNPDNGCCINDNHDHWIELRDFNDPDLSEYIREACSNLALSVGDLRDLLFH